MSDDDQFRELLTLWKESLKGFDIGAVDKITPLVTSLETIAEPLAKKPRFRSFLGAAPSLWLDLRKLWRDLARSQLTFWDGDDSESEDAAAEKIRQDNLRVMCLMLAKFTRNLVVGVVDNQVRAFENEPEIRRLLHYHTSWSATEGRESISVARMLAQTLSNMVTTNETLLANLWETYMHLSEDQVILIRLLASQDLRTLLTVMIFISNCIHGSKKRAQMLCRTPVGARVCICILDNMVALHDADETSEGAQAFDVGYGILANTIEHGLVPDLYERFSIHDEIITPHQTTLLKIVDSYLQSKQISTATPATPETIKIHKELSPTLAKIFFSLSAYSQHAVRRALGEPVTNGASAESTQLAELDVMLPKACEALVLVTQCIVTICLASDEHSNNPPAAGRPSSETDMKAFFNEQTSSGQGLPESLIELLRLLDKFLPRINFGKPVTDARQGSPNPTQQSMADQGGFQYLKRDLVRLLAVLSYQVKAVQDRVRHCRGLEVVMNMCVIDERNPYLREHAIFALHNLLENNVENQAVVGEIKPVAEWDDDGLLVNKPVRR